jgi:hypothetical protein
LLPALVATRSRCWAAAAAYNVLFVLGLATGRVCAFPLLRRFNAGRPPSSVPVRVLPAVTLPLGT